jgi:hypothetical protein
MQLIRKHMSADLILLLAKTKRLMMARIAPVPEPATIAFDDVPPESLNWRASAMGVMTRLAATAATASIYASLDFKELLPTVLAYARNALHRSRLIRAFLTAMLASTSSLSRSRDKEFRFTVLANAVNSGRIMFRHDSKLQFSICVQRPASVNALAGLAAL